MKTPALIILTSLLLVACSKKDRDDAPADPTDTIDTVWHYSLSGDASVKVYYSQ